MESKELTIILAAGGINAFNLPVGTNRSNAMIPVNGRPVIAWLLEDLLEKGIRQAVVVLNQQDRQLREFLKQTYNLRMELTLVSFPGESTILESLKAGLGAGVSKGVVRIVLGDTLIRDSYWGERDFVYIHRVSDSHRWCLVEADESGKVLNYFDKRETVISPYMALCGYYHFVDGDLLRLCVEKCLEQGKRQISDVLGLYGEHRSISAVYAENWYDFGNIDNLVDSRRRLLQSRHFNTLTVDPILNTIKKVSTYDEKLRDELDWYNQVPDELKVLCPRIVGRKEIDGRLHLTQEYYGYPTLAELYLFSDMHTQTWFSIINRVLRVHEEFRRYPDPGTVNSGNIEYMYFQKTFDRLAALSEDEPGWKELLARPHVVFNGRTLVNVPLLAEKLAARVNLMSSEFKSCIIHGDFCFSNILFDVVNQIVRLIDPRGSFGEKGIYGDPRYDIAKLRHSLRGLYDYITADMFDLNGGDGIFSGTIFKGDIAEAVGDYFDLQIERLGYNLEEVKLIEGLLFISMLPFHKGNKKRQYMMYLQGLTVLNDCLTDGGLNRGGGSL